MSYEYSDLEIKAILGAEDITYNPNFLSFLTKKIRGGQLIEQQESIIAYLKRLANIRAFYPQALKVFEEIVLLEPQKLKNYFETVEKICSKYPEKRILENLSKRSLNFIGILAPQRKYQSEIIDNLGFDTVEEGVDAALKAGADIVVLCSSDDEYATYAVPAYQCLAGRAMFIVAGAPACMDELKAAGIENFIHVRCNVLETLKEYNAKLGIK